MNKKILGVIVVVALVVAALLFGSGTLSQGRLLGRSAVNSGSFMKPFCITPEQYYKKSVESGEKEQKSTPPEGEDPDLISGGTKDGGEGGESGGNQDLKVVIYPGALIGVGVNGENTVAGDDANSSGGGDGNVTEEEEYTDPGKWWVDCGCKRQGYEWDEYNDELGEVVTYVCAKHPPYVCAKPEWQCPKGTQIDWAKITNDCQQLKQSMCKNEVASFIQSVDTNLSALCNLYAEDVMAADCYTPDECKGYENAGDGKGTDVDAVKKVLEKKGIKEGTAGYKNAYEQELKKAWPCYLLYSEMY